VGVSAAVSNSVLIRNVTVHPVTAPEMPNSSVLVIDGKIAEIGPHWPRIKGRVL
jgi:imidazolonepropionase-like amidohydrolase